MKPTIYPPQDPRELEPHYSAHVAALSAEWLPNSKEAVATQLAWRDKRIAELEALLYSLPGVGDPGADVEGWKLRIFFPRTRTYGCVATEEMLAVAGFVPATELAASVKRVSELATELGAARASDARIEELEQQLERQTPFALDWRDALAGIAEDLGVPVGHSLAADVRPALRARLAELEESWRTAVAETDAWRFWAANKHGSPLTSDGAAREHVDSGMQFVNEARVRLQGQVVRLSLVAAEAAAMLAETCHGGLTHARSASTRRALVAANVAIPAYCSACPHGPETEWLYCPRNCRVDHEPVKLVPGQRCPECRELALLR